jgi:hypothetical protein
VIDEIHKENAKSILATFGTTSEAVLDIGDVFSNRQNAYHDSHFKSSCFGKQIRCSRIYGKVRLRPIQVWRRFKLQLISGDPAIDEKNCATNFA